MRFPTVILASVQLTQLASAEAVNVTNRGPVDLAKLTCVGIDRSSVITRVCYDSKNEYLIVKINETYVQHCNVHMQVYAEFLAALSVGNYYDAHIKGSSIGGPFVCRPR